MKKVLFGVLLGAIGAIGALANCPGVKMDGEGDGIPCERQWCGSH